jgi:hypothetical protein
LAGTNVSNSIIDVFFIPYKYGAIQKTFQRNWQHWVHKTQDKDEQNKKYNTENLKR